MAEASSLPMGVPPGAPAPLDSMDHDGPPSGPRDSSRSSVHRPRNAPSDPEESNVLGVFGISIRTNEQDLEDEFGKHGPVDKVVIVYDQRTSRSRGFGFVTMSTVDAARVAVKELNGVDLHGRRIRVDFSVTKRPHDPTPGRYMGEKEDRPFGRDRDYPRRDDRGGYDRDRSYSSRPSYGGRDYDYDRRDRDRDRYDDRDRYRSRDYDRNYDLDRSQRRRSRSRSPRRDRAPLPDDRR